MSKRGFASDNAATIHPDVLEAIAEANTGHAFGYGHDALTQRVEGMFKEQFGRDASALVVGQAASVAFLIGPRQCLPLRPSSDWRFARSRHHCPQ